jgi:hypothetical protein
MTHDQKLRLDTLIIRFLSGDQMQRLSFGQNNESDWIDTDILPLSKHINLDHFRFKPKEPTREEITAQWVKDNDVKVGDKVKVTVDKPFMCKGAIYTVKEISNYCITCEGFAEQCDFNVEDIEKVTSKIVKFTFSDREEFRGKWVRYKNKKKECAISCIEEHRILFLYDGGYVCASFETALEQLEFIDGKPFGKEIWE